MTAAFYKKDAKVSFFQAFNVYCVYLSLRCIETNKTIKRWNLESNIITPEVRVEGYEVVYVIEFFKSEKSEDIILPLDTYSLIGVGN